MLKRLFAILAVCAVFISAVAAGPLSAGASSVACLKACCKPAEITERSTESCCQKGTPPAKELSHQPDDAPRCPSCIIVKVVPATLLEPVTVSSLATAACEPELMRSSLGEIIWLGLEGRVPPVPPPRA